jgi:hypothetical protein
LRRSNSQDSEEFDIVEGKLDCHSCIVKWHAQICT